MSNIRSISEIAERTGQSVQEVQQEIEAMIREGQMPGAYIDYESGVVVFPDQNTSPDPVGEPNQPNATNVVEESVAKIPFPWFFFGSTLFMILSLLLLGIAIGGVGLVICSILFVVFVVAWVIQYFQDKGRLYCKKCKRKYDFAEDVEYRQIGHRVKSYSYNPKGSEHQIMSREYFKLQIGCTCPNCEIKKEFKSEYVGRETFYDGGIKDHDPELEIEKFFRNGIGGSKLFNLIFVAIGVVLLGIAIALFATRVNDPKNYYGTYYAVQDQYAVLSLELKEDGTYTLIQDDLLGDMYDRHESGSYTFLDKRQVKKLENPLYDDKCALQLEIPGSSDVYIVWLLPQPDGTMAVQFHDDSGIGTLPQMATSKVDDSEYVFDIEDILPIINGLGLEYGGWYENSAGEWERDYLKRLNFYYDGNGDIVASMSESDGEIRDYNYVCVSDDFVESRIGKRVSSEYCVVLYEGNQAYVFEVYDGYLRIESNIRDYYYFDIRGGTIW